MSLSGLLPQRSIAALTLAITAALQLTACGTSAPTVRDAGAYVGAPLLDAEVMPVINEERSNLKVVVVDAPDGVDPLARQAQLGKLLTKSVEELLSGRGVEVVDDALAPALDDALRKAEAVSGGGGSGYAGPKVAKYAIKPVVASSNYGAVYKAAFQFYDKKGNAYTTPAGYDHSASVSTIVRVYEMPSLRLVGTASAKGSASFTDPRQAANQGAGASLLKQAMADAVKNGSVDLLNMFSSRGYVVQRRIHNEKKTSAFQVSMGTADGLKAGDKVEIYSVRPAESSMLKSAPTHEEIFVASGVVSGMLLTDATAWIVLDEEELAVKVRRGDLVKQKHAKKGFMDIINDVVKPL